MEKKRVSAEELLESAASPKARVAGDAMRRSLAKALSDPLYKNDPLRGIFTERENIKTELDLYEELAAAAHSLDKDAELGKNTRDGRRKGGQKISIPAQEDRVVWERTAVTIKRKEQKKFPPKELASRVRKALSLPQSREQSIYKHFLALKKPV